MSKQPPKQQSQKPCSLPKPGPGQKKQKASQAEGKGGKTQESQTPPSSQPQGDKAKGGSSNPQRGQDGAGDQAKGQNGGRGGGKGGGGSRGKGGGRGRGGSKGGGRGGKSTLGANKAAVPLLSVPLQPGFSPAPGGLSSSFPQQPGGCPGTQAQPPRALSQAPPQQPGPGHGIPPSPLGSFSGYGNAPSPQQGQFQNYGNAPSPQQGQFQNYGNAPPQGQFQSYGNAPSPQQGQFQSYGNAPSPQQGQFQSYGNAPPHSQFQNYGNAPPQGQFQNYGNAPPPQQSQFQSYGNAPSPQQGQFQNYGNAPSSQQGQFQSYGNAPPLLGNLPAYGNAAMPASTFTDHGSIPSQPGNFTSFRNVPGHSGTASQFDRGSGPSHPSGHVTNPSLMGCLPTPMGQSPPHGRTPHQPRNRTNRNPPPLLHPAQGPTPQPLGIQPQPLPGHALPPGQAHRAAPRTRGGGRGGRRGGRNAREGGRGRGGKSGGGQTSDSGCRGSMRRADSWMSLASEATSAADDADFVDIQDGDDDDISDAESAKAEPAPFSAGSRRRGRGNSKRSPRNQRGRGGPRRRGQQQNVRLNEGQHLLHGSQEAEDMPIMELDKDGNIVQVRAGESLCDSGDEDRESGSDQGGGGALRERGKERQGGRSEQVANRGFTHGREEDGTSHLENLSSRQDLAAEDGAAASVDPAGATAAEATADEDAAKREKRRLQRKRQRQNKQLRKQPANNDTEKLCPVNIVTVPKDEEEDDGTDEGDEENDSEIDEDSSEDDTFDDDSDDGAYYVRVNKVIYKKVVHGGSKLGSKSSHLKRVTSIRYKTQFRPKLTTKEPSAKSTRSDPLPSGSAPKVSGRSASSLGMASCAEGLASEPEKAPREQMPSEKDTKSKSRPDKAPREQMPLEKGPERAFREQMPSEKGPDRAFREQMPSEKETKSKSRPDKASREQMPSEKGPERAFRERMPSEKGPERAFREQMPSEKGPERAFREQMPSEKETKSKSRPDKASREQMPSEKGPDGAFRERMPSEKGPDGAFRERMPSEKETKSKSRPDKAPREQMPSEKGPDGAFRERMPSEKGPEKAFREQTPSEKETKSKSRPDKAPREQMPSEKGPDGAFRERMPSEKGPEKAFREQMPSEKETKSKSRPDHRKTSESTADKESAATHREQCQRADEIVLYMLRSCQGRVVTDDQVVKLLREFPDCFLVADRFKTSKFHVFKQDEKVRFVTAYHKMARVCLDYVSPREGQAECTKPDCPYFHVCRDFIMGACPYEERRCRFSHDLGDETNMSRRRKHRMGGLRDEDVATLLACSSPRLCLAYNGGAGCSEFACPDLHFCFRQFRRHCLKGEACERYHSWKGCKHNEWILDVFFLSRSPEPLLFKCVLIQRELTSAMQQAVGSQPRSDHGSSGQEGEKLSVDIFRYLLRACRGRIITSQQFEAATTKFPEFLAIVNRNKLSKFRVFSREGKVRCVTAYQKEARVCIDYNTKPHPRSKRAAGCEKEQCPFFHLCKDFLTGSCPGGCGFSHSFREEPNRSLCANLGLDVLSEEELRVLFACSMPRVCYAYNQSQGCREFMCPDLHFCLRQFRRQCLDGSGCTRSHGWQDSEHNQWVLDVYRMKNFKDGLLFKSVLLGTQDDLRPLDTADQEDDHQEEPHPHQELSSPGKADEDVICENFVWGTCDGKERCLGYHGNQRLPYAWQVEIERCWVDVLPEWNRRLEKAFCTVERRLEHVQLMGQTFTVTVDMDEMTARFDDVVRWGLNDFARVKRKSTPSFVQCKGDNPVEHYTRWRWMFMEDSGLAQQFEPASLQATLEEKFLKGQRTYHFKRDRFLYELSFPSMTQTNLETGKQRRLVHRPVYVSEEDVLFGCSDSSPLREAVPPASSLAVPPHWSALDRWQDVELVKLDSSLDRAEYQDVRTDFYKTLDPQRQCVGAIYRVQNPGLWEQFECQRRTMQNQLRLEGRTHSVTEARLFHGTDSHEVVRGICVQNFDHRMCGKNATVYGQGAYFARDAKYSDSYTQGHPRFMFRARVLVGDFTKGTSDMKRPPSRKDHVLFDSCVDNVHSPSIYVVFKLTQCYPEYLIEYSIPELSSAPPHPAQNPPAPAQAYSSSGLPASSGRSSVGGLGAPGAVNPPSPPAPAPPAASPPVSIYSPQSQQSQAPLSPRTRRALLAVLQNRGDTSAPSPSPTSPSPDLNQLPPLSYPHSPPTYPHSPPTYPYPPSASAASTTSSHPRQGKAGSKNQGCSVM